MTPRGRDRGRPEPPRPAGPRGQLAALADRLSGVIEPVTRQVGFDLEDVAVSRVGRRHTVQVVIDADGGVGLDAIAEISRAVSAALDAADEAGTVVVPGEYVLEVSSPGVDRPLTEPRHWRRNVGRLVTVAGPEGRTVTGRIAAADGQRVVLDVDGDTRELAYPQLGPGRVQVELRRPDDAGDDDDEGEGDRR